MTHGSVNCAERSRGERGFTLVNGLAILAVALLVTGIAVPMISGYLGDGRRARAEADVKRIARAVTSFYKDFGAWPARSASGTDNTVRVLCSGPELPATNPFSRNHLLSTWLLDGVHGDTLDNHLIDNTPGGSEAAVYPTTGALRWRGPYTDEALPVDPWGHPYLVTVYSGFATSATNYKRLFVLSAGPNGLIDTSPTFSAATDLAGDDIGLIISQRQ